MKYSTSNPPLTCYMRQSRWFKKAPAAVPMGICWHSTGANNPNLKRYVQPDDNAADRAEMLAKLGTNQNRNDWNHQPDLQAGVHAFIGKLADGTVTTVNVGPWAKEGWGVGKSKKTGLSINPNWIQFEMCEDTLMDPDYFEAVYREGVELTAYLCKLYSLNPLGTVQYHGITVPVILCHQDSYQLGLGSNHGDVYNWFNRYGKTMDDVRRDVAALMVEPEPVQNEEAEEMSYEKFCEYMDRYLAGLLKQEPDAWSASAREWAQKAGVLNGGQDGQPMWKGFATREQLAQVLLNYNAFLTQAINMAAQKA